MAARNRSLCVFCGSSDAVDKAYFDVARAVGTMLAERSVRLVYGGASVGMMGALAEAALLHRGAVLGVIPAVLDAPERAHRGLTELRVVDTMHTRKKLMADESDGFLALPGGFGTLDELFEIATWRQLGLHNKPIVILNVDGYYNALVEWMRRAEQAGFVSQQAEGTLEVLSDLGALEDWIARMPGRPADIR